MAHRFRQSRFRSHADIGEDVNPSAYIVNLADCMLVLACGFMVALISAWDINLVSYEEIDEQTQMEEVDPEQLPEDITSGGSYYIDAGRVVQDPNTGTLYLIQDADEAAETAEVDDATSEEFADVGDAQEQSAESLEGSVETEEGIRSSRALGAD